ncbi:MAG: Ku protein [Phycisphaeraceae bacterium]
MPSRAIWRGQLRISLVNIPVRLHTATESGSRVRLNRLHRDCYLRVRNQPKCPRHGELENADIVKGYEYAKDQYVVIEPEELEQIKLSTNKVIEIQQFARADDVPAEHLDRPYYLSPDGPAGEQPYRMIRAAMAEAGVVAIGKVVLSGREQTVSIGPKGKGFLVMTLRLAGELRAAEPYFEDVKEDGEFDENQMKLAEQLIDNLVADFEPEHYEDRYEQKLRQLIEAKIEGETPVIAEEEPTPAPTDIMEALRQSVEQAASQKPPAQSARGRRKTGRKKKGA